MQLTLGSGVELREAEGSDVVDAEALHQPFIAVIEGDKSDIAQLSVRGVDNGLGFGLS